MDRIHLQAAVDIKTTGLQYGTNEIVQLSIVTFKEINSNPIEFKFKDSFVTNIKPTRPELADLNFLKNNNLVLDNVKDSPTPQQIRNTFFTWHEEVTYNAFLIPLSHSYYFGKPFFEIFLGEYYNNIFSNRFEDISCLALSLHRLRLITPKDYDIYSLRDYFNIDPSINNAFLVIKIYEKLLNIIKNTYI